MQDEDRDLIRRIERHKKEAEKATNDWRDEARELYDFAAGYQWTTEERAALEEKGKPPITYNRVDPFLDAVAGLEMLNRQEVRFLPREQGDTGVNEVLTGAAEWVRDQCDAEDEETDAFKDLLVCGMGWTGTRMDYEQDEDGLVIVERTDPLEMRWDPNAKKKNIRDARWIIRINNVADEKFKEMWGEDLYNRISLREAWAEENNPPEHDASNAWKYQDNAKDEHNKRTVQVVEYQWYDVENVYKVATPQGVKKLTASRFGRLKDMLEAAGYPYAKQRQRVYKRAFVAGNTVLDQSSNPDSYGFTYKCMTGKRDRNRNVWYGLVRGMKDPQKWANKFFSSILFEIVTSGRGIMAERDAFDNPRQAEESWARNDEITWTKPSAIQTGKIQQKTPNPYPEGLDRLMQFSIGAFRDVTGVNLEMMGLADRQQPGVLEAQRKQAGITIIAWAFDALRLYRKDHGRCLAYFIREYIADGRLIRIVGQQGAQYIPLLKQAVTFKYDVIVDEAPSSPNMKEKVWGMLQQLMPQLLQAQVPIPADIFDYMPVPEALAQNWKKMLQPPPPSPEQQQQAQLQLRDMAANVAETESKAQLNQAKVQEIGAKTNIDMQKTQADNILTIAKAREAAANTGQKLAG